MKIKKIKNCINCRNFVQNPWSITDECLGACNRDCDVVMIHKEDGVKTQDCWED